MQHASTEVFPDHRTVDWTIENPSPSAASSGTRYLVDAQTSFVGGASENRTGQIVDHRNLKCLFSEALEWSRSPVSTLLLVAATLC